MAAVTVLLAALVAAPGEALTGASWLGFGTALAQSAPKAPSSADHGRAAQADRDNRFGNDQPADDDQSDESSPETDQADQTDYIEVGDDGTVVDHPVPYSGDPVSDDVADEGVPASDADPQFGVPSDNAGSATLQRDRRSRETTSHAARSTAPAKAVAAGPGKVRKMQVLVELFTSEGCSACPAAGSLLADIAARSDVFAVSLHVDYWDYLGWTDSFAQPQFTTRQKAYARREGARSVFTPQMVIGGVAGVSAPKPGLVTQEIQRQAAQLGQVRAFVAGDEGRRRVTLTASKPLPFETDIILVRVQPSVEVEIRSGENIGRALRHVNVARDWDVVAKWDGQSPLLLDVATAAAHGRGEIVAIIVQERRAGPGGASLPGTVLGVVRLD